MVMPSGVEPKHSHIEFGWFDSFKKAVVINTCPLSEDERFKVEGNPPQKASAEEIKTGIRQV